MTPETHATVARAREEFLAIVADLRPELHRYCARLTGSVIEGEDIVQDTLAKAFYTLGLSSEVPNLRPWLFRIAHNTAVDFLKSHGQRLTDVHSDLSDIAGFDEAPDPVAVRAVLARFLVLPVLQRSAVILKDVLGHSLEETAETMETTVAAVKAALVRGRANLRGETAREAAASRAGRSDLDRYATLFNARDWDGVRAMVGDDCRLDLVSRSKRRGKDVGMYFTRYAKEDVSLRVVRLEERLALSAHLHGAERPSYFILLEFQDGKVQDIRDFRYVDYIATEAEFEPA
ncbi:MAG: sigma factor [Candidatus Eisenbacteria bacterium]|uniref:RNA polymerase sigma factor n=1 Tax=Eiseniibacteriota bacterium TaxID=2212470 RepID=A0A956LZ12_UNCEI|nr:RNA polymerase sigma factor [Candidatus Eisenbacteria bacterium]